VSAFGPRRLLIMPPAMTSLMMYLFAFVQAKDKVIWFQTKV